MMDIKRSDRLRKTAAIAALVLAINSTGATAELGTTGFFDGDVVSAITISSTDFEIKSEADLKAFLDPDQTQKKRGIINLDEGETIEVSECLGNLTGEKTIYGNGKTITIKGTDGKASPLFNEIESGSRIENVNIKTASSVHIESDTTVGAVCCKNNGEIRYVTVDAKVKSASNRDHDNATAGIICGENNGKIFGCIADGTLDTQNNYAGSLCGKNNQNGNIERCSCPATINFSDTSKFIGGFCGYNSGKIYDCIFEGYLPHSEWSKTYINSNSVDIASEYRKRRIGAFSGELNIKTGYIQNSLYNGRIKLTENEYNKLYAKSDNGVIENDNSAPKDFFCNGNYNVDSYMANTYRIDTYTYNDGTETKTIICHAHYHDKKYGDNQLENITASEYTKENGTVKEKLNKGSDAARPTDEGRDAFIWVDGENYPRLNLTAGSTSADITVNNRYYDGTEQPLITDASIGKGFGTILYRVGETGDWSEEIPKGTTAGKYTIYYKIQAGPGYENSAEKSVVAEIKPRQLKINDVSVSYTGQKLNDEIKSKVTVDNSPMKFGNGNDTGYGLVEGESCGIFDGSLQFLKGTDSVTVNDPGDYTISGKSDNTNYELISGKLTVTRPSADSVTLAAPTATAITYGDSLADSELSALSDSEKAFALGEKKWEWVNMGETPDATQDGDVQKFTARLKVDPNFDYSNLGEGFRLGKEASTEVSYEGAEDTYIYTEVPVQVDKRPIIIKWDDTEEYEFTGEKIIPAVTHEKFNNEDKTGYISEADENKYTYEVRVTPTSPVNVGNYTATVVFNYNKEFPENYVFNNAAKTYRIKTQTINELGDIRFEVPYGTDIAGIGVKLEEVLGDKLDTYCITKNFSVDGENEKSILDVKSDPYESVIEYTLRGDSNTGTAVDTNHHGEFKAYVTVLPKEIEPSWKSNAVLNKESGKNEIVYGTQADISAYLSDGVVLERDYINGKKPALITENGDGKIVGDYTATASIDESTFKTSNYVLKGNEYKYSITKATLTVTWDTTVLSYEPGKQQIPDADVTGFKYDDKNKFPYTVEVTKGDGITAGDHTASVKFKDKDELEKLYNVTYSDYNYPIGKKGTDEIISLPSASPIMYGQYIENSKLSDDSWKWARPIVGSTKRPDAGTYKDAPVERSKDTNYTYPKNIPGVTEEDKKFTGNVDVDVNKRPLEVVWGDERSFTYNGEEQYPSFTIKEGDKTGYVDLEDEQKYTVKVVPAKGYDGKSAGKQKATVEFIDKTLPENYYIVVEPVEYEIVVKSIRDIGDVETTVTYGDTSAVKAVREAVKAELLKKYADFDKNYVILDDFSVENKTENDILDVNEYTSTIRYTRVKHDAAENIADSNFVGTFTAKVTVVPKQIMVQWNTNTTYNEETKRNEIEYSKNIAPEVTPYLEEGALCERDKNEKLDYSASPEGHNVGDYTVKASLEDTNYELYNDEFTYTVTEGKADIKITDKLEATYGDPVSSVKLPENKEGTFKWKNPDELVGDVGDREHDAIFIPNEGSNYKETELKVTVKVYPKAVRLIWNIENGHEFTFNGGEQNVTVRADLRDVYDDDEKEFAASFTADDLVNAGSHKAVGAVNNRNYTIAAGTESRDFTILPSSELQPMSYSETYEYGTTAKEIFDDLFAKHFGDFSAFAEKYSVEPGSVEVYKNGKKIDPTKYAKYIEACAQLQSGMVDNGVIDQLNQIGSRIYNKPDFDIMTCYSDYKQIESLVNSNSGRIVSFIQAGVLPEASKYQKLIKIFERYESFRDAENIMQEVGDYKIVVNYNHMDDAKNPDFTRFLKLSNNYHPASLTAEVKITPRIINSIFADIDSRPYDGTTDLKKVNGYTFYSEKNGEKKNWTVDGYHTINCQFVSPDAGTDKINTEIVLTNENFCFGYDYRTGETVKSKKFYSAETDGCITKAEFPYTVNLEGFAGERLSSIAAPSVIHGTFKWNDTETLIAEGANDVAASEFTFTPDPKDKFNSNYDMKLTVKVNGVKKPVETVIETAVETVIVTGEPQPAVTEDTGKPVTTAETETTTKATEAATTPAGTETTSAGTTAVTTTVTEAKTETTAVTTTATETKPDTTAVTTTVTETKAETTASTSAAVTTTVTETTTAGVTTAATLPEITVPASTTAKLMGEVTDAPVIVTKPVTSADTKAETTAKTEVTTAAETTAATTAKTEETKAVTTASTTGAVTAAETTVQAATVTLPETTAATTAKSEVTKAAETTANAETEAPEAVTTAAATTARAEETKAVTTAVTTGAVTAAETTVQAATVTLPETTKAAVTSATEITKAETTASAETEKPSATEATKAVTTSKTEDTVTTAATSAAVTTAEVTSAAAETVTTAETTVITAGATTAESTASETTAATTTVTEAASAETTSEVTEATPAATLPTLPEITLPVVTTEKLMGDVTEPEVTAAVTTSEEVTTAAVTTPAVTEETKTDLEKIREIVINEPEKVNKEVREDEKISINGEEIKLSLEDKMFFQGTESFDYPVRLKDFNAEKAYFDYAGFGFELPAGFTVDPESLSTDLKGNIKFYAPDSIEALALASKTGYTANGGYVVFRGVETRNLAPDAVLFTVKVKVADTLNVCVSRIGVSALYGRLTENSKFVEDGKVEPHVAFIDNGAGEQLYTKADSSVCMGVKGDVNLDGKVSQVDATIILREILSLEVLKESLLADSINLHDGTAEEAVALSHFLGNVNQSPNGLFTQIDATSILRGILERDVHNTGIVTEEIWKKVTNK